MKNAIGERDGLNKKWFIDEREIHNSEQSVGHFLMLLETVTEFVICDAAASYSTFLKQRRLR